MSDLPVGKGITKVSRVKNDNLVSPLQQVGAHHVPSKGTTASNKEGLRLLTSIDDLSDHSDTVTEDGDEGGRYVRGSGSGISQQDWIGELDRSGDTISLSASLKEGQGSEVSPSVPG